MKCRLDYISEASTCNCFKFFSFIRKSNMVHSTLYNKSPVDIYPDYSTGHGYFRVERDCSIH